MTRKRKSAVWSRECAPTMTGKAACAFRWTALAISLAGITYASAQAADTPETSTEETAQMSSTDIFFNNADGISTDGENWVAEADYEKNNPAPDVEWWTAEEYEKWILSFKRKYPV